MALGTALAIGLGSAALSAGGSALSASSQKKAAGKAADAQAQAAAENNALQRDIYASNKTALSPFMDRGNTAGNYLNAFLGLPSQQVTAAASPGSAGTPAYAGADAASQVQYLLGVGDSKTGRAMQNYYNANQGADPQQLLATLRGMADSGEISRLNSYVSANPARAAVPGMGANPAAASPAVTMADANNAFGSYISNSDYGFQFATGANQVNSGYAGTGALQSGSAMKALEKYRQNLQAGYRNEYTGQLAGQSAQGLGAASALAGVGQNYAGAVGANNQNAADGRSNAALIAGQNNGLGNALGTIGGVGLSGALGALRPAGSMGSSSTWPRGIY